MFETEAHLVRSNLIIIWLVVLWFTLFVQLYIVKSQSRMQTLAMDLLQQTASDIILSIIIIN